MNEYPSPPESFIAFINAHSRFLIAGHKEPDADCIGSQLALASALRRLGKTVILCQAGPFKRKEIAAFAPLFISEINEDLRRGSALIIADCSSAERTGALEEQLSGLPTAVIDHHAAGRVIDGAVRYVEPEAEAAVLLVFYLFKALHLSITREEADFLFLGLCADTGFFRHLDSGSAQVFDVAAALVRAGAHPKETFALMNGGKSLNSRLLLGTVLSRAAPYFGGALIISSEELEETEKLGLESRDSDSLYQLLQSIEGVEAIAIIRQESVENCTVGLRSRDSVDVSKIAADLGGGGHKNAAGFITKGTINEVREKVLAAFTKIF